PLHQGHPRPSGSGELKQRPQRAELVLAADERLPRLLGVQPLAEAVKTRDDVASLGWLRWHPPAGRSDAIKRGPTGHPTTTRSSSAAGRIPATAASWAGTPAQASGRRRGRVHTYRM